MIIVGLSISVFANNYHLKFINPSDNVCKLNGGKVDNYGCRSSWENAKNICRISGGRLPTIEELRTIVDMCGGTNTSPTDNNLETIIETNYSNKNYQACYKAEGFAFTSYWTSSTYLKIHGYALSVTIYNGMQDNLHIWISNHIRCVGIKQ
jgi:hypothetical protein